MRKTLHSALGAIVAVLLALPALGQGHLGEHALPDGRCLVGENINGFCLYCGGIGQPLCPSMGNHCSDESDRYHPVLIGNVPYCMRTDPEDNKKGNCGFQGKPACVKDLVQCQTGFLQVAATGSFCIACGEIGQPCCVSPRRELQCNTDAECTRNPTAYAWDHPETLLERGTCVAKSWMSYIKSGKTFNVVLDATPNKIGTLAAGMTYSVTYQNGAFTCTGFNLGTGAVGTWTYSNANVDTFQISLWGVVFTFNDRGEVFLSGLLIGHLRQ